VVINVVGVPAELSFESEDSVTCRRALRCVQVQRAQPSQVWLINSNVTYHSIIMTSSFRELVGSIVHSESHHHEKVYLCESLVHECVKRRIRFRFVHACYFGLLRLTARVPEQVHWNLQETSNHVHDNQHFSTTSFWDHLKEWKSLPMSRHQEDVLRDGTVQKYATQHPLIML
jgi:hypothetical protein